ncbi:D-aspartate oxidase-like isoform X1 [Stylophora pistillata]|uniref:D-aspartate oxidase n=1 Tax=Stylophora pistillata TaxID=50429 RepID=A0A2B4RX84_STYPI|nr:D-aspartate oxidase-like isoform X1 [Stylophora pistillata]PFX20957.1 D-aspartate oxidase [Stylophora pistillata]
MSSVAVVGAGVIGLSSAVSILERDPTIKVTLIADKFSPYTTSDGAAGLIMPFVMGCTPVHLQRKWFDETMKKLQELMKRKDAGQSLGIYKLSLVYLSDDENEEEPHWKDLVDGYHVLTQKELQKFPQSSKFGFSCRIMFLNGRHYDPWLLERFKHLGGYIIKKTLDSLEELAGVYDVVVNCSGMRAKELVNDFSMDPVRGQVLRVFAPWIKEAYALDTKHLQKQERYCYILPQANGEVVLGGTGYHQTSDTKISADDTRHILEVTRELVPSLARAPVLEAWVGLRPGRSSVRLEREVMKFNKNLGNEKTLKVVHNYGHGGGGLTVHWGCAKDCMDLVFQFLAEEHKSKL